MSLESNWNVSAVCCLSALFGSVVGCGVDATHNATEVAVLHRALEDGCADAPADAYGDFLAIMSSTEQLDLAEPQAYGSSGCSGFIFEFDNRDQEPLHGAWVQASGRSQDDADTFSADRCAARELQADYWGYHDKEWTRLASVESTALFSSGSEPGSASCALDALMLEDGNFEKLRIVAHVTDGAETFPMIACLW